MILLIYEYNKEFLGNNKPPSNRNWELVFSRMEKIMGVGNKIEGHFDNVEGSGHSSGWCGVRMFCAKNPTINSIVNPSI